MKKPVIGIVMKHYKKGHPDDTVIHGTIKRAIFQMGGLGIGIVPPCAGMVRSVDMAPEKRLTRAEQEDLTDQLALCDGVILQGGGYNDAYEVFVARYCLEHKIPTLGICAGYFNMIRAAGGKTKVLDKEERKRHKDTTHPIRIFSPKLQKIMGCKSITVNSRHRGKAVNKGKLVWAANGADKIHEAAHMPGQFYLAVQFHPEDLLDQEPFRRLFSAFIEAAGKQ